MMKNLKLELDMEKALQLLGYIKYRIPGITIEDCRKVIKTADILYNYSHGATTGIVRGLKWESKFGMVKGSSDIGLLSPDELSVIDHLLSIEREDLVKFDPAAYSDWCIFD